MLAFGVNDLDLAVEHVKDIFAAGGKEDFLARVMDGGQLLDLVLSGLIEPCVFEGDSGLTRDDFEKVQVFLRKCFMTGLVVYIENAQHFCVATLHRHANE